MKSADSTGQYLTQEQWAAYEVFVASYKHNLRRIANRTGGEHNLHDVSMEAVLLAIKMRDKHGFNLDFSNAGFVDSLMRYLYQQFVPYADTKVRHATRFEQGVRGNEDAPHPLVNTLTSDDDRDPLALLIAKEEALGTEGDVDSHPSLAAAYIRLLEHFGHHMISVASHLLLSLSHTYRRISHARVLAIHQQPLTLPLPSEQFVPGPWRSFKLKRPHIQLELEFDDEPALALGP